MARCRSTVKVERPIHLILNLDCRLVHTRFSVYEFIFLQYMSELRTTLEEMQPQRLGRNYALYWTGSPAVATGLWVQRLTVAWLTWKMNSSGFWQALIATADLLPSIALGPVAGILADRLNRKRLTLLCQTSNVALVLILASFISDGHIDRYWLLSFAVLNGLIAGIQQPVRMSLTATLVSKPQIAKAVTLMSINAHAARFAGPLMVGSWHSGRHHTPSSPPRHSMA